MKGKKDSNKHVPVLLNLILELIERENRNFARQAFTFIDGTLGLGGHASQILQKFPQSKLIGLERDSKSLELAKENLLSYTRELRTLFFHTRFSQIKKLCKQEIENSEEILEKNLEKNLEKDLKKDLRFVLLDLGISSYQLENADYGLNFNFQESHQLDMRLDPWCQSTALNLINRLSQKELGDLFWQNSQFSRSKKLARLIVERRPVKNSAEFIQLCLKAAGKSKIHPATLPMMALRIAVNQELEELESGLPEIIDFLPSQAYLLVISFHSGEDRIVKNVFRTYKNTKILKSISKKPLRAEQEEICFNQRARSAKLRIAQKI